MRRVARNHWDTVREESVRNTAYMDVDLLCQLCNFNSNMREIVWEVESRDSEIVFFKEKYNVYLIIYI